MNVMKSRNTSKINNDNDERNMDKWKIKEKNSREDNTHNRGDETCLSLQSTIPRRKVYTYLSSITLCFPQLFLGMLGLKL